MAQMSGRMRGRRVAGERGSGWATATYEQKSAWLKRMSARCSRDGLFKSRPSSACGYCGDDPVRVGQDPYEYDREHGWDWC
jgi:hypothetical protein